jgi:hypothetical protein
MIKISRNNIVTFVTKDWRIGDYRLLLQTKNICKCSVFKVYSIILR